MNRPPSHCRQSLFPGFPVHHHNQKGEQLSQSRQEQLHKQDQQRQSQLQQQAPHNSQAFLESQAAEHMKREALESRLESENAYIDQMDLSLAAAAAAAAAHHHNAAGLHHPNSRHHELENNLHKGLHSIFPFFLSIFLFIVVRN